MLNKGYIKKESALSFIFTVADFWHIQIKSKQKQCRKNCSVFLAKKNIECDSFLIPLNCPSIDFSRRYKYLCMMLFYIIHGVSDTITPSKFLIKYRHQKGRKKHKLHCF